MKKYELTDEAIEVHGATLRRVKYLDTGKLGGFIESEANLSQDDKARVLDDARVYGDARVSGGAQV